ncbi:ERMES complex subunit mmm1, partial [Kickxella alabastrina]
MEDASQLLSATATTVSPTSGPTLSTAVNIVAGTALVAAVSVSAPGRGGIGSNSVVQDMITAAVSATLSTVAETATAAAAAAGSSLVETVQSTVVAETRHLISIQLPAFVQQLWTWQPTFMQGFILGQFSMLVLLIMAIKYILFEEPLGKKPLDEEEPMAFSPMASAAAGDVEAKGRTIIQEGGFGLSKFMIFSRKPKDPPPDDLAEELTKMHKEILSRTGYDLLARRSESCDWLTVFLAQIISKFRADAERHDRLVRVISEALNGELRPSVIDNLRITQFSLGSDFLRVTSARMVP